MSPTNIVISAVAAWLAFSVPAPAADDGELAFNNHCRTCHSTKEADNRLGPSLHNIYGAKAGAASGYGNYSQSLASSGITWDQTTLDKFIANPDEVVSNNNMKPYKGIGDEAVRKAIIAFLKSKSGAGDAGAAPR
jgi:cytochrome c